MTGPAIPDWVGQYVGIPFVDVGRTRAGCDCYGLVRLVWHEQFDNLIPSFDAYVDSVRECRSLSRKIEGQRRRFARRIPPDEARPGDGILLRQGTDRAHVAIYAGMDMGHPMALHTTSDRGHSCIERLDNDDLRNSNPTYHRPL